ncbi:MAG: Crp/Fnr family transcriptional regulator [Granulosicoccus sp.]|nr:Crp/Fnr family transcriptional regulator [Granulosicoccus sp.]
MSNLLEDTPFFSGFPEKALARLESKSAVRKFKKNTHLVVSGDDCHSAYVMISGNAHAYTDDADGNEFIVNSFHEGDCFGELGVLDGLPRTANVITATPCECLVIPKVELVHVIENEPEVALSIIKTLVGRIRSMTEDVSCLALMDVYGRLARVLAAESQEHDDGITRTDRITHQELSKKVGASREMISKILKDLKTGGYIDTVDHCIVTKKKLPDRW